jgi:hypothetical protein
MAYYTGRDVAVWITTEHADDTIKVMDNVSPPKLEVYSTASSDGTINVANGKTHIGSLGNAGDADWQITDMTAVDVSIGAQDEDISFIGLRNMGKIEVKKDTSITITRKKHDNFFTMLNQGSCTAAHAEDEIGLHGARWGLIEGDSGGGSGMNIASGITDPKATVDDVSNTDKSCYGYRVYLALKEESSGLGEIFIIPNCIFSEYSTTMANETANEESFTLTSQCEPIIWNGTLVSGLFGPADGKARIQTLSTNM